LCQVSFKTGWLKLIPMFFVFAETLSLTLP
jgi:hypothetical protein